MNCPFCIKKCTKCKKLLVACKINFDKQKGGLYGLHSQCKTCRKESIYYWRSRNKERYNKKRKEWYDNNENYNHEYYKNNKEYLDEKNKKYREEHEKELKEYHCEYYKNNKEKWEEWNILNRDKILKQKKVWRNNNPDKVFNYNNSRRLKEENQGRGITKEQWLEMMIFFDWKCAYSGEKLTDNTRTIDHIIALDNGGLNEPWNCVPMIKEYNQSKYIKDMILWYKEQDFYSENRLMKIYEWQEYAFEKWGLKNILM